MDARPWLREWFGRKGPVPAPEADYFEAGFLDSLGAVELVAAMEKEFSVKFEQEHFQQARFSTLGGLAELIGELSRASGRPPR